MWVNLLFLALVFMLIVAILVSTGKIKSSESFGFTVAAIFMSMLWVIFFHVATVMILYGTEIEVTLEQSLYRGAGVLLFLLMAKAVWK